MPYRQLGSQERQCIDCMYRDGHLQAHIARVLRRAPSTISRELQRDLGSLRVSALGHMSGYIAGEADRKAQARRAAANAQRMRIADNALGDYVRAGLVTYWSPQQIAERIQLDHADEPEMRISHEAIYQWVYRQAQAGEEWHRQLRRARRRRRPRIPRRNKGKTTFLGAVGIDQRPTVVSERSRLGDWESDTVVGMRRSRPVLATHVERTSRYVLIRKLVNARAVTFNRGAVRAFADVPVQRRLTLTADNGGEFARFASLQKRLGLRVFFAEPYKAWQRGANENTNGLIRQFFAKGTDLAGVSHQQVAKVQDLLNNRPRKCLNYRTPAEVFLASPVVALRT